MYIKHWPLPLLCRWQKISTQLWILVNTAPPLPSKFCGKQEYLKTTSTQRGTTEHRKFAEHTQAIPVYMPASPAPGPLVLVWTTNHFQKNETDPCVYVLPDCGGGLASPRVRVRVRVNVFIALKGTHFLFSFAFTAAGVVQCGVVKRFPVHQL